MSTSLKDSVRGLPTVLRQAAKILERKANENGGRSLLTPKLNWYAEQIENAMEEKEIEHWKEALEKEATDRTAPSHPFCYVNKTKRQIFTDSAEWAKQWIENNVLVK